MTPKNTEPHKGNPPSEEERDLLPELGLKRPVEPKPAQTNDPENSKATEFNGHQAPEGAPDDTFSPQDDTPAILKKKEGPRNTDS